MSTPESHPQTITRCAAGRGWLWWVEAFRMIKEAPGPWFLIGAGYLTITMALYLLLMVVMAVSTWIGSIGYILYYAIMPCFVVGFVAAGWTQARGGAPKFLHLFSGFKADVKTLMSVGVTVTALWALSFLVSFLVLGSDFVTELENLKANDKMALLELLTSARLWLALLVFTTLVTLVWVADWLAPMVVVFQRTGVVTALRSSFMGLMINWRALSVWGLVAFAIGVVAGIVLFILIKVPMGIALTSDGGNGLVTILFLFILLLLLIAELLFLPLIVSLGMLMAFVAYCDIFHAKDGVFPRPAKTR